MRKKQEKKIVEKSATLGDLLNADLVKELKDKKKRVRNEGSTKKEGRRGEKKRRTPIKGKK